MSVTPSAQSDANSDRRRPNLLVIHTDQQSCWTLSAYAGTLVRTPAIDRIGREGAIFNNFFTNSALCTPSRGCLVTGRYPHAHGAYTNNISLDRSEITFAQVLLARGYETGYAGKWHLDGPNRPGWLHPERSMGFRDCKFMFNRGHWKMIEDARMSDVEPTVHPYDVIGDEQTYTTDWLVGKTISFIERQCGAPFCYMLSIPDPHGPCWVRPPYDTMYKPEDMPIPATFSQEGLPDWAEAARTKGPFALDKPDRDETLRGQMALYCGEVRLIDDCVGRIFDCLEREGILDDTIIVFTSDHGDYMGEHGLHGKNQLFETAYRVPMLVRWPRRIAAGTVVDNVVSTVDFQPTILSLMDVPPSGREQGRDASGLLLGRETEWAEEAFLHHSELDRAGIFTPQYELAHVRNGDGILFDRLSDPEQTVNLFDDPGHSSIVEELTARIIDHNVDVGAPAAAWLKDLQRRR